MKLPGTLANFDIKMVVFLFIKKRSQLVFYQLKRFKQKAKKRRKQKKKNFEVILGFSVPSIILADLLGNTCFLERAQSVMVCDL